uniref:uncharacterized protein LOC100186022 isoform X4 n=1 Tax=Ciona intestinalis TaxID=7719 RepID=UPI000EF50CC5|nr:uncharacterized protein LOC100186022 isoform X4 [Ciona intestinalis]|eukprot:XP_026695275.1 uncharacterized protein LOC100186022 isoform X4 [Ciona intestinalis]
MKKHQTMDSPSRLPFEELHKQAKRTANEELASNLPKAPIGLVNSTKEKFNKRIQEICEEYRTAYKNPEEELLENAMGKILESVTIYKNMVGEATGNSFISETDFERIHQQSKAAALECLEKSSIRNKENFANTLNTAIKQEHEKALEVLKTRLVTPNTVAKQQAIKPKHSFKFGEIIVQVANCGITDLPKSNIIVNSVGSDFILARGQVSRILLHHVGPKLQTECKNNPKFATESYRITFGKE